MKTGQKVERDTDPIMAERENAENIPVAEKAPMPGEYATDWGNYQNWYNYMNYQNWLGGTNGEKIPIPPKEKGSFDKGDQNLTGRAPMTDHGGEAYQDSDCDLKTNEMSLANNIPLLSEFSFYVA